MTLYTADWTPLEKNVYYRKTELYSMEWNDQINLSEFMIAGAQFGGPIAIVRDDKKFQKVFESVKPIISIFTSSGQNISQIQWQNNKLVHLAWSSTEDLLCITEDGIIHSYDIHGKFQRATKMGPEVEDTKVIECKVFHHGQYTGVVVLTGAYRFFLINDVKEPRVRKMANPCLSAPPSSWTVVSEDRVTKVLVAKDAELLILDQNKDKYTTVALKFNSPIDAIVEIAVSCNHQHIAFFSDSGPIWLGSTNLEDKYTEFNTESKTRPQQLVWCGNGAIVGVWQNIMLVIGLDHQSSYLDYYYKTAVHMIPEIDCVRIVGNTTHELLQKVPDAVVDVFKIGSVSSSALLLEASKEFQNKNHRADEYLRMIREKNEMEIAVENCINAAGHEFLPATQKMLLRAAMFGKSFIPDLDASPFVNMCQILRILNNIRINTIGIPLTITQLEFLTSRVVLDRLLLRRHYPLAIEICKYIKIPDTEGKSRILSRWACYKVKSTNIDPERTAEIIASKLGYTPGISYSEIANKAVDSGHTQLSVKLLDYETRASEQVPLLIKLKHEDQAMKKAIESGDTDLIFTVILHLKNSLKKGEFHMTIRKFPVAFALYLKFCREQDFELLRESFDQESDYSSEADCRILESYSAKRPEVCITSLQTAAELYRKGKNEFSAQITEDQVKLRRYQIKLEDKLQDSYLNLSLHETARKILVKGEYEWADALRKDFKIPDRRFWWLKILVIAERGEWLELEKFSKSKKSPIGYEPFVDVCLQFGSPIEAKQYLSKIKDENKVKYYVKVGLLEEAAKIAFEQKDISSLDYIQSFTTIMDRTLNEKIMTMKSQLTVKK